MIYHEVAYIYIYIYIYRNKPIIIVNYDSELC